MARKRSSVRPATFALALSTLGPAWAARLETSTNADFLTSRGGVFKRATRCHAANGVFATLLCMIGLSI